MDDAKPTVGARIKIGLSGSLAVTASLFLAGCATDQKTSLLSGAEPLERVVGPHDRVTPGGGRYQVGRPYTIGGRTYYPREDAGLDQTGVASWYGGDYHHGTRTANGEVYDRTTLSAAHKTMPLPSYARVTNLKNGRSIVVRVNDRGPYVGNRVIDLSEKTAEMLDMKRHGVGQVRVQYIGRAGLAGSDQRILAATLRGPDVMPAGDERTLVAQADLKAGPRMNAPASAAILVASAKPAPAPVVPTQMVLAATTRPAPVGTAQASLVARAQTVPVFPRTASAPGVTVAPAFAPVADASSFELAGVDPRTMRGAIVATKPLSRSADVIATQMPGASGAPLALMPLPAGAGAIAASAPEAPVPPPSRRSSYAAEAGLGTTHAAFRNIGIGELLSELD